MPKDESNRTSENRRQSKGDSDLVPYSLKKKGPSHRRRDEGEGDVMPEREASGGVSSVVDDVASGVVQLQGIRPSSSDVSLPGSFFQSSRNVHVNGGEFSSSQLHHTNFTININRTSDSVEMGGSMVQNHDTSESAHTSDLRPPRALHNTPRSVKPVSTAKGLMRRDDSETEDPSETHQPPRRRPSLPIQKSSEIYFRHLAAKSRGTPLWIPEPNDMLPVEYQRNGIEMGDVGIITDSGGFDFLFNVCLPREDPINPGDLPEDFEFLRYPEARDIYGNSEFKTNSYLASSLVETSRRDGESPSGLVFTFESSATDGAVLTMPNGAHSRDLRSITAFRKHASQNAEKWYTYANGARGREARNGDIRLVVGYHKSDAWGMAAFCDLSAEHSAFRLRFQRVGDGRGGGGGGVAAAGSFGWECSGVAEVKSGPDAREIERLRARARALEYEAAESSRQGEEGRVSYENQCLFVRTINVSLQDAVWRRLNRSWELMDMDDYEEAQTPTHDELGPQYQSSSERPSIPGASSNMTSEASPGTSGSGSHGRDVVMRDSELLDVELQNLGPLPHPVHLSTPPMALDIHPSKFINQCLLKERPNMKMAITEDKDWMSVLEPDETVLPPSEILFSRMMTMNETCEDEGTVFLKPYDSEAELPSTPPPLSERELKYPESLRECVDSNLLASLSRSFSRSERATKLSLSHEPPTPSRPPPLFMELDIKNPYPTPLPRPFSIDEIGPMLSEASRSVLGLDKPEVKPDSSQPAPEVCLSIPATQRSSQPPSTPPPAPAPDPALSAIQALLDPEAAYPTPVSVPLHRRH